MKKFTNQTGFALLPVLLLTVIVALVGIVGWRVYDMQVTNNVSKNETNTTNTGTQATASTPLNTKADVEKEQANLESATVDTDLDASSLDQDLDSLL